jgi:signal transduction histidine kinase
MSAEEVSYANRIATNGLHLLGLINDILDLSKIEAGRMTLELSTVMLDTLVRETIAELEGQVGDRSVELRAEIPSEMRSMETDAARLKQVLINLIGNSLKFTEAGEVVVSIEVDENGTPSLLTVRDTGIGIPQARLDAIFNVFEQAESMIARRFGGTGLGLAISRSLCELMGHQLTYPASRARAPRWPFALVRRRAPPAGTRRWACRQSSHLSKRGARAAIVGRRSSSSSTTIRMRACCSVS